MEEMCQPQHMGPLRHGIYQKWGSHLCHRLVLRLRNLGLPFPPFRGSVCFSVERGRGSKASVHPASPPLLPPPPSPSQRGPPWVAEFLQPEWETMACHQDTPGFSGRSNLGIRMSPLMDGVHRPQPLLGSNTNRSLTGWGFRTRNVGLDPGAGPTGRCRWALCLPSLPALPAVAKHAGELQCPRGPAGHLEGQERGGARKNPVPPSACGSHEPAEPTHWYPSLLSES